METLRHAQAKVTELEKTNKKLNEKAHSDMKEIIRLKEEIQSYRTKVCTTYCHYVQTTPHCHYVQTTPHCHHVQTTPSLPLCTNHTPTFTFKT